MKRRGLVWKIFPSYVVVVLLTAGVTLWYARSESWRLVHRQTAEELHELAHLLALQTPHLLAQQQEAVLREIVRDLAAKTAVRATVVLTSGRVLADSEADPQRMENHADRPEIAAALQDSYGKSIRYSSTVRHHMMYVAVPFFAAERLAGVCRVAKPLTALSEANRRLTARIACGALGAVALAILLGIWLTRKLTAPIQDMEAAALRLAAGDFRARLSLPSARELAAVATAFNSMAAQMAERVTTITAQNEELEAILSSMVEGVLAVDSDQRVLSLNRAGAEMLQLNPVEVSGKPIHDVLRTPGIFDVLEKTLTSQVPVEIDIAMHKPSGDRHLQVHGTQLQQAASSTPAGAVLVMNDITRLKHLESLRRDFAANVSHELKTPITSIKGFVETLRDGAIEEPGDAHRFLDIIQAQAERLNALINDLLALAKLERESEEGSVPFSVQAIRPHLENAVHSRQHKAAAKHMSITVDCPEDLTLRLSPRLFEEAVANLVDNAIAYSPGKTSITISARENDQVVTVTVSDQGRGIAPEHLDRLFERFYRVDRGRSRDDGGTGLGLAIVKHVAQTHGGRVTVSSIPGNGSDFSIILPKTR